MGVFKRNGYVKECTSCAEYRNCRDSYASWIFFIIGLIATIAIRAVTLLIHVDPLYGKIAWYTGVTGFLVFFLHKYRINRRRAQIIEKNGLIVKLSGREKLTEEEYTLLGSILCGISSAKERINYFVIFGLSAVALAIALYLDLIR